MMEALAKIGIIGVGMVGAPLARYFQEVKGYARGKDLFLFDTDPVKGYDDDINRADVIFISVPSPRSPDGSAKIDVVESALSQIDGEKIVVIKSTVPPGTTRIFQERYPRHKFLFNPEFLTEAKAWENTIHPDRQLVGWTPPSKNVANTVLALLPQAPLMAPSDKLELSATEAEIIKYGANMFLTRKVTFANAIYDIAEDHGVNYENVRAGIASDPRIGSSHLDAMAHGYRGYGGYCFVKDTDALIAHCEERGLDHCAELFAQDREFNTRLLEKQGLTPEDVSVHDNKIKNQISPYQSKHGTGQAKIKMKM